MAASSSLQLARSASMAAASASARREQPRDVPLSAETTSLKAFASARAVSAASSNPRRSADVITMLPSLATRTCASDNPISARKKVGNIIIRHISRHGIHRLPYCFIMLDLLNLS